MPDRNGSKYCCPEAGCSVVFCSSPFHQNERLLLLPDRCSKSMAAEEPKSTMYPGALPVSAVFGADTADVALPVYVARLVGLGLGLGLGVVVCSASDLLVFPLSLPPLSAFLFSSSFSGVFSGGTGELAGSIFGMARVSVWAGSPAQKRLSMPSSLSVAAFVTVHSPQSCSAVVLSIR